MEMNISLLQAAVGKLVEGPVVRIPNGNYRIEKNGSYSDCKMIIDGSVPLDMNSKIILSNNSSIRLVASECNNLTVRFIRET